jgi:hypothetical protein
MKEHLYLFPKLAFGLKQPELEIEQEPIKNIIVIGLPSDWRILLFFTK